MAEGKKGGFVDLLDGTFSLMSKTWTTSLILGAILFIPTSLLFGWAYGAFFDAIKGMAGTGEEDYGPMLATLGIGYLWLALATLAQGLVYLFVRACVTEHAARASRGEPADTLSVVIHVATRRYATLLGQRVLQVMIYSITIAGGAALSSVAGGLFTALHFEVPAVILAVLFGLAGLVVVIWVSVRYMVTLESLVIDGKGIEQSIDASMDLVRRRWWRVFGYTLLFGLMVDFASSLIGTPIVFFSTIRQIIQGLQELLRDTSGSQDFNAVLMRMLSGLGRRLGILQYVQSLITAFVAPVFMTLLFLQLKKRSAEAVAPPDLAPTGTVP